MSPDKKEMIEVCLKMQNLVIFNDMKQLKEIISESFSTIEKGLVPHLKQAVAAVRLDLFNNVCFHICLFFEQDKWTI